MKPLFFDCETTGVEENDRIIQVAFQEHGSGVRYESLHKPPVPISIDAMSICHITNEMVESKPSFVDSANFKMLENEFLNPDSVFVAHNAQFDMKFLSKEGLKLPEKYICTMKMAHHHDKDGLLTKHNLQFLRYYLGLKFSEEINPHDATSDIIVLEGLFKHYLQFHTIEEMVEISSKPILLKKMSFGKYKGEWFRDIAKKDMGYIKWMKSDMKMDENMNYTVNYYLENL